MRHASGQEREHEGRNQNEQIGPGDVRNVPAPLNMMQNAIFFRRFCWQKVGI
jgi:hypothetical protein